MAAAELVALVMAGGSGTRFWPASRKHLPKQFLNLIGDKSLIASTVDRIRPLVVTSDIYVCSTAAHEALLEKTIPDVKGRIFEPEGKNTAPCLMLSLLHLLRAGVSRDAVMVVLPADHYIADETGFRATIRQAAELAAVTGGLVTLGIVPDSPHTGYGYIEAGEAAAGAFKVRRFIEKPDKQTAEDLLARGGFFWNAGIFVWTLAALEEAFKKHMAEAWAKLSAYRETRDLAAIYAGLHAEPVDVAVLEKAANLYVIPASIGWSDVGSWSALYALRVPEGEDKNLVLAGHVKFRGSHGCLVQISDNIRVALVGVRDLVVVEKDGILLIADRAHDQQVKHVAGEFEPPG